jgi:O-antigen ligase
LKSKLYLQDKSGQIRLAQWSETWKMMSEERLLISGAGLSNYQKSVKPYHQEGIFIKDYNDSKWLNKVMFNNEFRKKSWQPLEIYLYPHNIFLNFWVELGLLGLVVYLIITIKFFSKLLILLKKKYTNKLLNLGLLASMTTIIVHGLVDVPYFKNDLSILFWLLLSLLSINIIKHNNGKNAADKSYS